MAAALALTIRSALDVEPDQVDPGRSSMRGATLWFRSYRQERAIELRDGGCMVVDRIVAEPYLPGLSVLALPLLARDAEREHTALRRTYGGPERDAPRAERTLAAGAEQEAALVIGGAVLLTVIAAALAYTLGRSHGRES